MAWTSNVAKILFIAIGASLVIFIGSLIYSGQPDIVQPIAYNHNLHIETVGMECADCHQYVEKMARATIPKLEVCMGCHSDEPISESPEEVKLLKYIAEGREIAWKRVYHVPDHVYFSHRRHVVLGELDCSVCHGNMAELTKPVSSQYQSITMSYCVDCHKRRKVTTDCLACHR